MEFDQLMSILGKRKLNHPEKTQTKKLKECVVDTCSDDSEGMTEVELTDEEDSVEIGSENDPFFVHFDNGRGDTIAQLAKQIKAKEWNQNSWTCPVLDMVAAHGLEPIQPLKPIKSLEGLFLKSKVREQWSSLQKKMTPLQSHLYSYIYEYKDLLYGSLSHDNMEEVRNIYCLHAVNHCLKIRNKITKNNAKLKLQSEELADDSPRDQGFTRPKVLILAPFKNSALNIVQKVIHLSGALQFDNKKRFLDEYGLDPEKDAIDSKKPDDHQKTFAGKIDDCFRLGVQFAKKNVKLYCPFYSSDLIVASPLGLRMAIESGEKNDFLSSIEMVILDSANVLLMQNWEHVEYIFQHLNQIPKNPHETDFSRVKSWYLDGNAGFVRQTMVFSSMLTPELNTLYNSHMNNVDGKLKVRSDPGNGTKSQVLQPILQTLIRIKSRDVVEANDARFKYFTERLFPDLKEDISEKKHYVLFVPNYFDYVRLRNWLTEQSVNFASLSDYTSTSDISRARTEFYHEKVDMIVLTERFHFYRRYKIKGVKHYLFYGLPDNAHFYPELLNHMHGVDEELTCTVLYNKYDRLKLERIVGIPKALKLLQSPRDKITL